ncbi:hypothetical protein K431DRAFT_283897 [Polychaeton citri CBS 116435]|uniref:Aminoglycoside phosphotransferase domain-containing protein n=1 Tax=Polychaeton citri CBS 116435 TaxID=1314669 RepID=A0A9P4QB41_9PEZI|nr:hypothetical protein K431DRAFT_283897 [Polychaeton citri CBS 116435]
MHEDRVLALDRNQRETGAEGTALADSHVLTRGDLSDWNVLVDPSTLEVTDFTDGELANVAPAYFEYAVARLSGGYQPEWRKELLEILREVLRIECKREVAHLGGAANSQLNLESRSKELYRDTLAAWKYS